MATLSPKGKPGKGKVCDIITLLGPGTPSAA
jgi:hypothetical protein